MPQQKQIHDMKEDKVKEEKMPEAQEMKEEKSEAKVLKEENPKTDKENAETKAQEKKTGDKKETLKEKVEIKKQPTRPKKTEAIVNGSAVHMSTLDAKFICKFVKNKKIERAIADLEKVILKKMAVPMKGEIPHRKGESIMSGRYPKKASKQFIALLKNLQANANANGLDDPVVVEAIANMASRPYGSYGRIRRKRTHIKIVAKDVKQANNKKKTKEKA